MDTLRPLSYEEVAGVLDGLAEAVQRKPLLAKDPAFVGSARLALTAARAASRSPAPVVKVPVAVPPPAPTAPTAPPPPAPKLVENVDSLLRSVLHLMLRSDVTPDPDLVRDLRARLGKDPAHVELEAEGQRLQSALAKESRRASELEREVQSVRKELALAREEVDGLRPQLKEVRDLREKVRKATEDAEATAAGHASALRLKEESAASLRTRVATEQKKLEALREQVAKLEFGATSRYTYKNTKKPIGSCPVCGGLNPAGLNAGDKDVGHKANCWLSGIVKSLAG